MSKFRRYTERSGRTATGYIGLEEVLKYTRIQITTLGNTHEPRLGNVTLEDAILTRFLGHNIANDEGISGVSFRTHANWRVINDRAARQKAARARTRIPTFFPDASFVGGAVRTDRTLGSTVGRDTDVILHADARWRATDSSAHGIGSTGRW